MFPGSSVGLICYGGGGCFLDRRCFALWGREQRTAVDNFWQIFHLWLYSCSFRFTYKKNHFNVLRHYLLMKYNTTSFFLFFQKLRSHPQPQSLAPHSQIESQKTNKLFKTSCVWHRKILVHPSRFTFKIKKTPISPNVSNFKEKLCSRIKRY